MNVESTRPHDRHAGHACQRAERWARRRATGQLTEKLISRTTSGVAPARHAAARATLQEDLDRAAQVRGGHAERQRVGIVGHRPSPPRAGGLYVGLGSYGRGQGIRRRTPSQQRTTIPDRRAFTRATRVRPERFSVKRILALRSADSRKRSRIMIAPRFLESQPPRRQHNRDQHTPSRTNRTRDIPAKGWRWLLPALWRCLRSSNTIVRHASTLVPEVLAFIEDSQPSTGRRWGAPRATY
jgi:hypothetical protein